MEIKKCHYCESSMPAHFPACPYCGRNQSLLRGVLLLVLILTVVLVVYFKLKGKSSENVPMPPELMKSEWSQPGELPQQIPGEEGIVPNAGIMDGAKEMKPVKKQESFEALGGIDAKALDEALRSEKKFVPAPSSDETRYRDWVRKQAESERSFRGSAVPPGTE